MKRIILALLSAAVMAPVSAAVKINSCLTDSMVIQRNSALKITGKAAGRVCVTASWESDTPRCATAGNDSVFSIVVPTPDAGGPFTISVTDGDGSTLTLDDIYSGEVWLCSGQSNMEMPLAGWGQVLNYAEEIADAVNYPNIRLLQINRHIACDPQEDAVVNDGGWHKAAPGTIDNFSAVAYFFARELSDNLGGIPVGVIDCTWGGTPVESWTSIGGCREIGGLDLSAVENNIADKVQYNSPAVLYNAMVYPLRDMSLAGAIWYQGCANVGRDQQYSLLFPRMITDWRRLFDNDSMPFYFVQIANFLARQEIQPDSEWAALRAAQTAALSLPFTAMATAIDIGEANDIHPKNKQEVARRLSLLALKNTYGVDSLIDTVPVPTTVEWNGDNVRIRFDAPIVSIGGRPQSFIVRVADGTWQKPKVKIEDKSVSLHANAEITEIKYNWADNPDGNLYGMTGLPVLPFKQTNKP